MAVLRSSFVTIVQAVQTQLVNAGIVSSDQIHLISRQQHDIPHFVGDQDILIRPGRFRSIEGQAAVAGRVATVFNRVLEIFPRTRVVLDESDRDAIFLTDQGTADPVNSPAGLGIFALEEAIVNSLHIFLPVDSNGNALTWEPMRIITGEAPEKQRDDPLWGYSSLDFEVVYMFNANQAVQ